MDQFTLPNIHTLTDHPFWQRVWPFLERTRYSTFLPLKALAKPFHEAYEAACKHFLHQLAQTYQARILHSHYGPIAWRNLQIAKQASLKHVVTFYGHDVNQLPTQDARWLKRYKDLFRHIDLVLCEGPYMAQSIVALGCPEHKVKVHHLGVTVDQLSFQPRTWQPGEPLRILIAAAFREKKGVPYALQALGQLQREVPIEITLIGDANFRASSQAEKQKILATINEYHLNDKVRLLGYQPYALLLQEAYQHHLLLSPSVTASDGDTEGGAPVVLIEMMATGMHIVSTNHCDIPEVASPLVREHLAEERDVAGLIRQLKWLLARPTEWKAILEAGRRHVEKEFNAQTQADRLMMIYQQL
jgi:colanic acid/amylovoran biosynthesis glycosyltransferase